MTDYSPEDWQRLGRAVKRDRTQRTEYRDIKRWAAAIGRSTRIALGLERGERVGDETLLRVEKLLGWPADHAWRILEGADEGARQDEVLLSDGEDDPGADVVALFDEDPPLRIRMHRYEDLRQVGSAVRKSGAAIMDTTEVNDDLEAMRMVDFAAGIVFGLGGRLERLTPRTFLLHAPVQRASTADDQLARGRSRMAAAPEHAEFDVEAAHESPEPAGLPEPESP